MDDRWKKWIWVLFLAYCAGMVWLLFGQRLGWDEPVPYGPGVNLRPMDTIRLMWPLLDGQFGRTLQVFAVVNLIGNVIVFVPGGFFLPVLFRPMRRLWLLAITALLAVSAVEGTQYLFHLGSCDVDDIILNVAGMLIGYGFYKLMKKLSSR